MSELGSASQEALVQFEDAVRKDPSLIGQLLSWAIEQGVMPMPDDGAPGVTTEEVAQELANERMYEAGVGFDFTAARRAQQRALLESQRKALLNPKVNITEER